MAIVKMKKLRVMAVANRREELLRGLLRLGCVEISEPDDKLSDPAWSTLLRRESSNLTQTRTEIADVNAALAAIKQYAKVKEGLFIQRKPVSEEVFLDAAGREPAKVASRAIGEALRPTGGAAALEVPGYAAGAGGHCPHAVPAGGMPRLHRHRSGPECLGRRGGGAL